ncbi:MAG TPA: hypothetical protein VJ864_01635 [Candidatus Binatia bacterium]|nr:hypothetical protein [Candidatus Binatia bacterium]
MLFFLRACSLLVVLLSATFQPANAQLHLQEYYDREYGYFFNHPATWKLHRMPEGDANSDSRVVLQGPNKSSFMVIIDSTRKILRKTDFENSSDRMQQVGEMMEQTIEQIYRGISTTIKSLDMKIGERRDLSNDVGVKFYLATLHSMKEGKPVIVAGIHAFPFDKDYSINFILTAFWDPAATQDNQMLTEVFNSFRLLGEPQTSGGPAKPPEDKDESR